MTRSIISALLFSTLLFISASTAFAQGLGGGLTIGFNSSQIDGDGYGGFYTVGANVGGFTNFAFNEYLALQPEIVWQQLGSGTKNLQIARLNYIAIPVLLKAGIPFVVGVNTEQNVSLEAGPSFGILLNAQDVAVIPIDITSSMRSLDLGLVAGVAYKFAPRFEVNLRYGWSAMSIFPDNNPRIIDANGWFNRYATFSLRFHLLQP